LGFGEPPSAAHLSRALTERLGHEGKSRQRCYPKQQRTGTKMSSLRCVEKVFERQALAENRLMPFEFETYEMPTFNEFASLFFWS
jgi:hypothetical protein